MHFFLDRQDNRAYCLPVHRSRTLSPDFTMRTLRGDFRTARVPVVDAGTVDAVETLAAREMDSRSADASRLALPEWLTPLAATDAGQGLIHAGAARRAD